MQKITKMFLKNMFLTKNYKIEIIFIRKNSVSNFSKEKKENFVSRCIFKNLKKNCIKMQKKNLF